MFTPAVAKGETGVRTSPSQLTIRKTRRPGRLAEGQVKILYPAVAPDRPGVLPSVYDCFGKIITEKLPGRQSGEVYRPLAHCS